MFIFGIPALVSMLTASAATAAVTGTQIAIGATVVGGGALVGKGLYDSGRKKGQAEGAEREVAAMRQAVADYDAHQVS